MPGVVLLFRFYFVRCILDYEFPAIFHFEGAVTWS